jgi:hypothetical protein
VLSRLSAAQGTQVAGAAGAGLAGGSVREAGGGPVEQFLASLAGGVGGGMAATGMASAGNALKKAVMPAPVQMQQVDQTINLTLQRAGVDWSQVPERVKQGMRQEVADAISTGKPLNADAMRRLLVYKETQTTPTVGQLTQDPGQITRERNLAKTGANSTSPGLQKLPAIENQNVAQLLKLLDESGAAGAPSQSGAGMAAINAMDATAARAKTNIGSLYSAARDTSGRSLPLERGTFTRTANQALDEANVGGFLPADIARKLNAIAKGEIPLTVEVAEQLKTSMGMIARNSSDGNVRYALGVVRKALDATPLEGSAPVNPGGLPAIPGMVPPSTAPGAESIKAFNAARSANREWMQRVEANPALKAVVDGVEPDQFVQKYLIGKGASAADVRALHSELTPEAQQAMRAYLARYLRDKATGGDADVVKFGGKTYRDALRDLEDKLPIFFKPEEIRQFRSIGDVAKYMQSQPAGSAVNNSNSGALMLGRGLDMLEQIAQKAPIGRDAITGVIQGMQQRQVLSPQNALTMMVPQSRQPIPVNPLIAASIITPADRRKNDRGD